MDLARHSNRRNSRSFNGWCVFSAGEHEAKPSGRRFCRRDSDWTAATCRLFCPPEQAEPSRIRPCREQSASKLAHWSLDSGRSCLGRRCGTSASHSAKGAHHTSPAQRAGHSNSQCQSAESAFHCLRDWGMGLDRCVLSSLSGLVSSSCDNPAINRWAIFERPCGRRNRDTLNTYWGVAPGLIWVGPSARVAPRRGICLAW